MAGSSPWELYERLSGDEVAGLSPEQRRLVAVGSLRTEVNNGGFDQYFFNSAGDLAADALAGARSANADELAAVIAHAISVLVLPEISDRDAGQDRLDAMDSDAFEELNQSFYALEASTDLDGVMRALVP
jgi:hypothetical protein